MSDTDPVYLPYLEELSGLPSGVAKASLCSLRGIGDTRASRFLQHVPDLLHELNADPRTVNTRDPTTIEILSTLTSEKESPLYAKIRDAGVQVDEPVTTDIRRLIRLPALFMQNQDSKLLH